MAERLQKVLASAGLGSRRACEQMILDGRVQVNGRVVRELPVLVESGDRVAVDGRTVRRERMVYYLLNKPRGVVCTNYDPAGRPRAVDLLTGVRERVFAVGRLDAESSGLLMMTNDGELANRLTHPRYEVAKTYEAQVDGRLGGPDMDRLLAGVWLAEGRARADRIRVVGREHDRTILAITLTESRNRQVRRMFARLGHKVRRLRRVAMGKLTIRGLGIGRYRPLTAGEVAELRRLTGLGGGAGGVRRGRPAGRRRRPKAAQTHPASG